VAKCTSQEEALKDLNAFYSERRSNEQKISSLESKIAELELRLGASTATTKEKEVAISDINQQLRGVAKTKDIINLCLSEASTLIRAALSLETAAESHDSKARRKDVLNQLLVLLNTAIAENKELRAMEAMTKIGGRPTSGVAAGRPTSGVAGERGRPEKQDSIEYEHGSLGLVPMSS
jgi:hypothetical protein